MKKLSLLLPALLLPFMCFCQGASGELDKINEVLPSEKIYLHTDRTFYSTTDDIFFKAYVLNGETYFPTRTSTVISVNLIDTKGNIKEKKNLPVNGGTAAGSFSFNNTPGGVYKIKAFTNWSGNLGEEAIFEKEITVQKVNYPHLLLKMETEKKSYLPGQSVNAWIKVNGLDNNPITDKKISCKVLYKGALIAEPALKTNNEGKGIISFKLPETIDKNDVLINAVVDHEGKTESINKPVIIDLEEITVDFLPEGGNLVNGLQCNVAFRAIKSNGKPVDIKGKIIDQNGNSVVDFESLKFGMGKFIFQPAEGNSYYAMVDSKNNSAQKIELPKSLPEGISVTYNKINDEEHYLQVNSTKEMEIIFLAQLHGRILRKEPFQLKTGSNIIPIHTKNLPAGIMQITLFDAKGMVPVAERLLFINKKNTLKVEITTNKEKYTPFEKVEMKLKVKDEHGHPVKGNFSLTVVDEKNLTLADNKQDNILSYLLMSSELKGKIEEPDFYFKADEPLADAALDLVMMTHGWRRYKWEEVLAYTQEDWKKKVKYAQEKPAYYGTLNDGDSYYRKLKNYDKIKVKLVKENIFTKPDSTGAYTFQVDKLTYPAKVKVTKGLYSETFRLTPNELSLNNNRIIYNPLSASAEFNSAVVVPEINGARTKAEEVVINYKIDSRELNGIANGSTITIIPGVVSTNDITLSEVVISSNNISNSDMSVSAMRIAPTKSIMVAGYYSYLTPNYGYSWPYDYYNNNQYYLSGHSINNNFYNKEFYSPVYNFEIKESHRLTDDRTTIYWNHTVNTNEKGEAEVTFYNAQQVSSYRAILEGTGEKGNIGRGEEVFYTQKPLTLETKIPKVVTKGDRFIVSCVISNNTKKEMTAEVLVSPSGEFGLTGEEKKFSCKIPADSFIVRDIELEALKKNNPNNGTSPNQIGISVSCGNFCDWTTRPVTVNNSGFEHYATTGGNELTKTFSFIVNDPLDQQITAGFEMILDAHKELDKSLAGMIREPGGCFEQVSASNYPNILALQYLQKSGKADPELTQKAMGHLASGYKQLARYETSAGGFEWYGHTPPHEALTAMGLMQFYEMRKLGIEIDEKLYTRTVKWLMGRRTKSGLFEQNQGKYGFSGAPRPTASAYITYALTCMGEKGMEPEIKAIQTDFDKAFDFYKGALLTNIYFKSGDTLNGKKLVKQLTVHVKKNGIVNIVTGPSVTYNNKPVSECIALLSIAIAENGLTEYAGELNEYIKYIYSTRTYYGSFGNTQTTVLCLAAIIAKKSFTSEESAKDGFVTITVNDSPPLKYGYGKNADLIVNDLGQYMDQGTNTVKIAFDTKDNKVPYYNFSASWKEIIPGDGSQSKVTVSTSFNKASYKTGEAARMEVNLKNRSDKGLPQTVAIIGTPAGLSFDSHELKRLQDDRVFDYYELKDNYLILYYAELAPSADINIPINLKAEIKGMYTTPPTCAYLYYNDENKSWSKSQAITVE